MRTATQNTHPMLATIEHPNGNGSDPGRDQVTNDRRAWLRFAGHYLEMVAAMLVGCSSWAGLCAQSWRPRTWRTPWTATRSS
jgi:hypothetical protein